MRLRNLKNGKEILLNSKYVAKKYNGFDNNNPVHMEIGIGMGDFIINMAKLYPNINFIGIEKFDSVLARAVKKINIEKLTNIKLMRLDAIDIKEYFKKEIDLLYLNFSDPWPKNRHEDRRLTSLVFLEKYDSIFKRDKIINFKTDNRKLFEFSLESLSNYGYKLKNISLDLHSDNVENNVMTEYEKKFSSKGFRIYRVEAYK